MKILIIGNGRMGKEIASLAPAMGHEVVYTIDHPTHWVAYDSMNSKADLAVEFSLPNAAVDNILECFSRKLPVVCGTTGWHQRLDEIKQVCLSGKHALIYASNFSPGMNITFELNRQMARLMNSFPAYDVSIEETHHVHKLDTPSGTAITLATDLIDEYSGKTRWDSTPVDNTDNLTITSHRIGETTGVHSIKWDSDFDRINLTHTAKNRKGFALGALMAAEWILKRTGCFSMKEMITQLLKE